MCDTRGKPPRSHIIDGSPPSLVVGPVVYGALFEGLLGGSSKVWVKKAGVNPATESKVKGVCRQTYRLFLLGLLIQQIDDYP
jgi:hypothetical protein